MLNSSFSQRRYPHLITSSIYSNSNQGHQISQGEDKSIDSPEFKYHLYHLLAVLPWARHLISLCLNFFICKMRMIMVVTISWDYWEN